MRRLTLILLATLACVPAFAIKVGQKKVVDNVEYQVLSSNTAGVVGIKDAQSVIVIPEVVYIENEPFLVTEILSRGGGAKKITSIELPPSIQSIGENAFAEFVSLNTINIPPSLTSIGVGAFQKCADLRSITLPPGLKMIKERTFAESGLMEIIIPYFVTDIEKEAFKGCKRLRKVTVQGPNIFIGDNAFSDCKELDDVALPELLRDNKVKKIFSNPKDIYFHVADPCPEPTVPVYKSKALETAEAPAPKATQQKEKAQKGNAGMAAGIAALTGQTPNRNAKSNGKAAKNGTKFTESGIEYKVTSATSCSVSKIKDNKMIDINIPESVIYKGNEYFVTEIEEDAAHKKNNLWSYTLYSGFSFMRGYYQMRNLVVPNTVISIGPNAFAGCTMLQNVSLPNSLVSIGEKAFEGCLSLTTLTLPSSVRMIGNDAFRGCDYLQVVAKPANIRENIFPNYLAIKFYDSEHLDQNAYAQDKQATDMAFEKVRNEAIEREKKEETTANISNYPGNAPTKNVETATPKSDVDLSIPKASVTRENTFAVLVANENYINEVPVKFAHNDGATMQRYFIEAMGLPESNVRLITDATRNQLVMQLDWLENVSSAFDGDVNLIFYYAGHGMPDESTNESFLIPADGSSTNSRTCIPLNDLYDALGAMNAKTVTVIMDACFSGAQRGNGMLMAARGVSIKSKPSQPKGNMVVLSATQEDETAYPFTEKEHGLFTYYLLKGLQEQGENASLGDLADYISKNVRQRSIVVNNKPQTPNTLVSPGISKTWRTMPFVSK